MLALTTVGTASGNPATPLSSPPDADFQGELSGTGTGDADYRTGSRAPSAEQRQLAEQTATAVRWNKFGTPATLLPASGSGAAVQSATADPVATARAYLTANKDLFGISDQTVERMDVLVNRPAGQGAIVMLRQRFGELPSASDGLVSLGIRGGEVVFLTSTLVPDAPAPAPATISGDEALSAALSNAGLDRDELATSRVLPAAVPMPGGEVRSAYQVVVVGEDQLDPTGYTTYVDGRTGEVLLRDDIIDFDVDNPKWDAFPANPPGDYSSVDTRETWCFTAAPGCDRVVSTADSGAAWDIDPATGQPSLTSVGNAERGTEKWDILGGGVGTRTSTTSPTRDYTYSWTNQWHDSGCDPAVFATPQQNDIDAALANLFAMHNRMHDWSYRLGFTEETWNMQVSNGTRGGLGNDPERGNAQAGGRAGGAPPNFPSRNNANQATPPDGLPPTTNMFLWQPTPGGFYPPCVDGDYDMTVIGHEYTHAISGRMIAGPDRGWSGFQAGSMNEATSDLFAQEYLFENGFRAVGNTEFVTGGYVTADPVTGIRNYDGSRSPLNYSNLGYDLVGPEVHSDGEIWVATSLAVRKALVDRYGIGTPALQRACADGRVSADKCPGNRRWAQLSFDALILSANGAVTMLDMRDALLGADMVRFGGVDVPIMWNAFAQRGMGRDATSTGSPDSEAVPSFASPHARNASLRMLPTLQASGAAIRLYVGDFEARSVPVADTDPSTELGDTFEIAPGTYHFLAAGSGFGSVRFTATVRPGQRGVLPLLMLRNVASEGSGASVSGDGVNQARLIDDSEATNWASVNAAPVAGKGVTVDLAGHGPQLVTRVQVSAYLRPSISGDPDTGGQNRFTALRTFEVLACNSAFGSDCADDADFRSVFTSADDAFPATAPRPTAPDLTTRSFRIKPTFATHLKIRVLTNQCTGGPDYAGQQHNDPRSTSDCATGNPVVASTVRIAEFQAFLI